MVRGEDCLVVDPFSLDNVTYSSRWNVVSFSLRGVAGWHGLHFSLKELLVESALLFHRDVIGKEHIAG